MIRGMRFNATPGYRPPTDHLAPYNIALGDELALPSNLTDTFTNVVAQIFPLAADLNTMQGFLDAYLNYPQDGENPPVYFKPAAPFVMLEVLNYGSVASNVANVGWFSQHEIAFGIPLEWYAREGDRLKFLTYALIYPYIFVDNPLSISGGREIYGWSKAPIRVNAITPAFAPASTRTLLDVSLLDRGTGPGEIADSHLLCIQQQQYLQLSASSLGEIVTAVPRAIISSVNAAFDLFQFSTAGSRSQGTSQLRFLRNVLSQVYGDVNKFLPAALQSGNSDSTVATDSPVSIITLKQVREIEHPGMPFEGRACYQGIIESEMSIKSLTDGGSLVDASSPDPTGGISIDLYDGGTAVASMLGLDAIKVTQGTDQLQRVFPIFPFWIEMDLTYGLADYQVWRTNKTYWTETNSPIYRSADHPIAYLDLGSGAAEEIAAPAVFPNVTMRIFPLAADGTRLDALLQAYLADPTYSITRVGAIGNDAVVTMILSNFAQMQTMAPLEGGPYSDYELTFAIPIRWENKQDATKWGLGLVPLYTFAGTYWNTITTSEVYGRLTLKSRFESPTFDTFLTPQYGPDGNLTLTVKTELFPEPNKAQELQELPIVEVYSVYTDPDVAVGSAPTQPLSTESVTINGFLTQIGLGQFITGATFLTGGLKQIRDANDPTKADYQASVWLGRSFTNQCPDGQYAIPAYNVHLYNYDNVSLVELFGLRYDSTYGATPIPGINATVAVVKAVNPKVVYGPLQSISADLGWWRIGNGPAVPNPNFNPPSAPPTPASPNPSSASASRTRRSGE